MPVLLNTSNSSDTDVFRRLSIDSAQTQFWQTCQLQKHFTISHMASNRGEYSPQTNYLMFQFTEVFDVCVYWDISAISTRAFSNVNGNMCHIAPVSYP